MLRRLLLRTWAIAQKEVVHIQRDPQILAFALGMPVILILIFGYGVSFDVEQVPLVLVDQDQTVSSRQLVDKFTASNTFRVIARRRSPEEVETLFRSQTAKAGLIIPRGYERQLRRGERADAQLLLDGADNTTASIALGYASAVSLAASQAELTKLLGPLEPTLSVRSRV
ncbi:MAG: ABC transporter permease, partial [Deltaproteobacteria bacterium]